MYSFSFEKLMAWQKSRLLTKSIYFLTKKLPPDERFGLISQIRRSVISVSSNIAEGSARGSFRDKAHFSQIAYSSLVELLNQIIICADLRYINDKDYSRIRNEISELSIILNAFRNS